MVRLFLFVPIRYSLKMQTPQLSIIVPVYNEIEQLPFFLERLSDQQNIRFELILCDGGSTDGTADKARPLAERTAYPVKVVESQKGRARQMNAGAESAIADTLLFLHVDSNFPDRHALQNSWTILTGAQKKSYKIIAGHFSLKFSRQDDTCPELYYHMECKARLDRKECTHGDQGFMVSRKSFNKVGQFDSLYPIAEDTRFADRLRDQGMWLLFPDLIQTSARRFEVEGVKERQTFSSILMNFIAMDWAVFFERSGDIYQTQDRLGRLQLLPYLQLVRQLLKGMSFSQRMRFWYATGSYVRQNAWQIPFYFDTRYQYRARLLPGTADNRRLEFHDKWIEPLINHPPGRVIAGLLTWIWYCVSLHRLSFSSEK